MASNPNETENRALRELFVDGEMAKVLGYLTDFPENEFSKTDLMRESGVSYNKMQRLIGPLERFGIIVETKRIARAKLYRLDKKNEIFRAVLNLEFKIVKATADREHKEDLVQKVEAVARGAGLQSHQ